MIVWDHNILRKIWAQYKKVPQHHIISSMFMVISKFDNWNPFFFFSQLLWELWKQLRRRRLWLMQGNYFSKVYMMMWTLYCWWMKNSPNKSIKIFTIFRQENSYWFIHKLKGSEINFVTYPFVKMNCLWYLSL